MTFEPEIQPSIRLDSFHLANLSFNVDQSSWKQDDIKDTQFKINFTQLIRDDKKNYFGILFKVFIENKEKTIVLNFDFVGHFEAKGIDLNDDVLDNNSLFKNSAPAIIFPYVRSFVSNFTINAGFKPIILPALNFIGLKKVDEKNKSSKKPLK